MRQRIAFSESQFPSVVTTLSLGLGMLMMMSKAVQAQLIYSIVMARIGLSRQNSQQAMQRRSAGSELKFPSMATTLLLEHSSLVRLIYLFVMARVGRSKQNLRQVTLPREVTSADQFQ